MHPDPLFLAVDGGGTNCRVKLCDANGAEIGSGVAGSANTTQGIDAAFQEIMKATGTAVQEAGFTEKCFERIHAGFGLAGLSLQRDHEAVNSYNHSFAGLAAETDAYIACLGAHQGQDGAILIVGTGSCGFMIQDNVPTSIGGWGYLMSDQGGGAQLGRAALRMALEEHDGFLPRSELGRSLMAQFMDSPEMMVSWSEAATPKSYGSFAPEIFNYAAQKDAAAVSLVQSSAQDVERMIKALVTKGAKEVVLIGGLTKPILPWLSNSVLGYLTEAKGDPLDGALMLARRNYEKAVTGE